MHVTRIVHLGGGFRVINPPGREVRVEWGLEILTSTDFVLPSFDALYSVAAGIGPSLVGVEIYGTSEEYQGFAPPSWRTLRANAPSPWPVGAQGDEWSFIAHTAFREKRARLCDIASRISHQLRVCDWRIKELSDLYRSQRRSAIKAGYATHGHRFEDGFTALAYQAIQAFLVDACVLRDYLGEFYAWTWATPEAVSGKGALTAFGPILKAMKARAPSDPLGVSLLAAADNGGWLRRLGSYRDLIVHAAPLANAGPRSVASVILSTTTGGRSVQLVRLPLPGDPEKLSKARASGEFFADPTLRFSTFDNILRDENADDALAYATDAVNRLAELARIAITLCPVPPTMPTFDESNIVGEVHFRRASDPKRTP